MAARRAPAYNVDATHQVVGLGNALVDALVRMDEREVITRQGLRRGHMNPVDHGRWQEVFHEVQDHHVEIQSGGSCANTIATLGFLGARSILVGQVGDDQMGHLYASRMQEACGAHALLWSRTHNTGKCLSLISEADAERTMLTHLGASIEMGTLGRLPELLPSAGLLHTEGYQLLGEPMKSRFREAVAVANQNQIPISLDVSDPFVVASCKAEMWELIEEFADIVFLNAEEARALCGAEPEVALGQVAALAETVVVKLGSQGSLISHKGEVVRVGVQPIQAVDTTGAGDAYAAGFLYGYVNGWSARRAGDLASRVAALTVAQVGAVVRDREALGRAISAARLS
jgi:sugar/nucleoside kinase (ribokinase family)